MSEYIMKSDGPGSIGALVPLAALSHPPTIGSNNMGRNIGLETHGPKTIPAMGSYSSGILSNGDGVFDGMGWADSWGCSGCGFGTENDNGNGMMGLPSWAPFAILGAVAGGIWWMKKKNA